MAPRTRHIPLRSCIACGEKRPKGELVRVVRTPYGNVGVDPTGKKSGRGAYLCPRPRCWEEGLRSKKLGRVEYALRGRIRSEEKEALLQFARTLARDAGAPQPHRE